MLRLRRLLVHRESHHAIAEHDEKVGAPKRESHGVLPRVATTGVKLGAPEGLPFCLLGKPLDKATGLIGGL